MLTCYNGFAVSLSVWSDPDELLSEERRDVCVAVHEDPNWLLE